jgi:hypothetical protein
VKGQFTKLNIAVSTLFIVSATNVLATEGLIKNGSFEDYTIRQDHGKHKEVEFTHWQGVGEVWNQGAGKPATKGVHKIELDVGDELDILSQAVITVKGKKYRFSVNAYAKRDRSSDFEILVDSELIATIKPNSLWAEYEAYFIGSGEKQLISIKEIDHQNNSVGAVIDNVQLQPTHELIVNGSFENFTVNKDYGRWKLVNFLGWDGVSEVWNKRLGRRATSGAYKMELDAGSELNSLAQTIQTQKDVLYIFSLDAYAKKQDSSDFEIWVDESKIADVNPSAKWHRYYFNFLGNGQAQRIQLREISHQNDEYGAVIDHVSLVSVGAPSVIADTVEQTNNNPDQTITIDQSIGEKTKAAADNPIIIEKQPDSTDKQIKTTQLVSKKIKVIVADQKTVAQQPVISAEEKKRIDIARQFGKATQPKKGDYKKYESADKAIDGDDKTYNHTQGEATKNWWQLELPSPTKVSQIMIQGRDVYEWRLYGAIVYLSDKPYSGKLNAKDRVATLKGNSDKQWIEFSTPKSGSYLIIKAKDRRPLHLTTVEVYGQTPDAPAFNSDDSQYLIDGKTLAGEVVARVKATDFQGDELTYSIIENVPFSIDNQGAIYTKGNLSKQYNFTVQASDGKQSVRTSVTISVTSSSSVNEALASGRVDLVTEDELIQATLDEIETGQQTTISASALAKIKILFTHFSHHDFNFDWSQCHQEKCGDVPELKSEFEAGAKAVKKIFTALDIDKKNIFNEEGYQLQKLLILTADKFRQTVAYPMDKVSTDDTAFMKSYFADHAIYHYRRINPAQKDMGNFSRSDFSHITPITKAIKIESKKGFRSAGVYALPGETMTVTRHDKNDLTVNVFINTLRPKATRQYREEGYKRPKYLQSPHVEIKSGESIELTSPYGGPVQLEFSQGDQPVSITFDNVGEHPYWNGEEDNESFKQKLAAGHYDWAEVATPVFEIHSTLDKMRQSVSNPKWGNVESLASATVHYMYDLPHRLAGYQGAGITPITELHDFADQQGWTVDTLNGVKHMNADQASCSTGCAGNPYDTSWAFDPVKLGDLHELSHGLQGRKRFEGWTGHSMTNYYAYYSQHQYYQETGKRLACQKLPFKESFMALQASINQPNPAAYVKENLWGKTAWSQATWSKGAVMFIQMMMAVQHEGVLQNGWLLRGRLHLFEREFNRSINNENIWNKKRASFGMSHYSLGDAQTIKNNDWLLIALSYTTERDFRDYLAIWAISFSDKAALQVASLDYKALKPQYFKSVTSAYCKGLDQPVIALDGQQAW